MKRFEEDGAPEDPAELQQYQENLQKIKQAKLRRDQDREYRMKYTPVMRNLLPTTVALARKGIPLESFDFKPSKEYPTIDDYISINPHFSRPLLTCICNSRTIE